jgi:hypothetical protein
MGCKRNAFFVDKKTFVEEYNHIIIGILLFIIILLALFLLLVFKRKKCI